MAILTKDYCENCDTSLQGAKIPQEYIDKGYYDRNTVYYSNLIGVEYSYDHPHHYDGISEWMCPFCNIRVGRWSGKVLADNESEPRYGGQV
jgi:hypothetical protein